MKSKDFLTLQRCSRLADKVMSLESQMAALTDKQMSNMTSAFQKRYQSGESLDSLLPEAFALVREAARRVLGLFPYKVQIMGGISLHWGNISEMRTGEGKTLTATMPVYLNALTGKGVHVVTVNEYLAGRDAQQMGELYKFLGLSTGLNTAALSPYAKKRAYMCDITYTTSSELGFDYLRDNMATDPEMLVQRGLHYCVIDETDSILIDEARTPLIIAGQSSQSTMMYFKVDHFVKSLTKDDYEVDIKSKSVHLTHRGIDKAEEHFRVDLLYDDANINLVHHIDQALHANYSMKNDVDYIVKDGAIAIIDSFTGRIMDGRQFSDGLHQALEAKEGVEVNDETITYATITFQNFFKMFEKLSGMTGTAKTEEKEFKKIYNMNVITIPTNRPVQRIDEPDLIFSSLEAKYHAVIDEIREIHKTGQPILVGTASVEVSELLSSMLKEHNIKHTVLNAKLHAREAEIVADAGQYGAVTISTNMAGRGTDIKLGHGVKELGGLYVIGTEKHESRRIDNQLRGRAGRQGDPGRSRFYLSLEDDLMKRFGGEKMKKLYEKLGGVEGDITTNALRRKVTSAQKRIEGNNYDTRKHVLEYDDVIKVHRDTIYGERHTIVTDQIDFDKLCLQMIDRTITRGLNRLMKGRKINLHLLADFSWDVLNKDLSIDELRLYSKSKKMLLDYMLGVGHRAYEEKCSQSAEVLVRNAQKRIILSEVDDKWVQHINNMDKLKDSVSLRSYAQIQPVTEYQFEAKELYENMIATIDESVTRRLLHEYF